MRRSRARPTVAEVDNARFLGASTIAAGVVLAAWSSVAGAAELYSGANLNLRWDNTLKYTAGFRVEDRSAALIANPNQDDGDRNFGPGPINNRLDLLTEADLHYRAVGVRASGAAWFDSIYNTTNDNDSPATANAVSVPHDHFTHATRDLHGRKAELLDGFGFFNGRVHGLPVTLRAGRHTLLWGESLLLADNGISYAQAPLDAIKALSVPNSQAKELFLPVAQLSALVQPREQLGVSGFYQLEYRRTRLPGVGSYFSSVDLLDAGGERLLLPMPAGAALFRGQDLAASNLGQWGLSARYRARAIDTDFGLYFIRFHDKLPQLYLRPGQGVEVALGKVGDYALVFPERITLLGASFSTTIAGASLAGEVHARHRMPLASTPQPVMPGAQADNDEHPLYAIADTVHGQVSVIYSFRPSPLWQGATVIGELGGQGVARYIENRAAVDPSRARWALGFRTIFTPTYFNVLPNLDLNVPITVAYNPWGKSPIAGFNGGAHNGGIVSVALSPQFRTVWLGTLQFTHYFGRKDFQVLGDRDFVSLSVQRTF
jgi:hypothetical protein